MPKIQEIDFWTETEFWVMQFVEAVALISAPNLKWKSQEMDFIVFFRTETETSSPKNLWKPNRRHFFSRLFQETNQNLKLTEKSVPSYFKSIYVYPSLYIYVIIFLRL